MAQVFPPGANWLARWTLAGGLVLAGTMVAVAAGVYWGPAVTLKGVYRQQPQIPFSHKRHVEGNGIDCRYCHTSVETGAFAGLPATETCMTCHSQVLTDQKMFEPVHASWRNNVPIEWIRINDLPDFVYFNHSIHVNKGIGCSTCHGRVDQMPLTYKAQTFHMRWCLQCHKAPEKFIRPREEVFNMEWEAPADQLELGRRLVDEYHVNKAQLINCSICHR